MILSKSRYSCAVDSLHYSLRKFTLFVLFTPVKELKKTPLISYRYLSNRDTNVMKKNSNKYVSTIPLFLFKLSY